MNFRSFRASTVLITASLAFAMMLAACGGDDDGASGSSGTDEQYVATVCKAELKLKSAVAEVSKDPSKLKNSSDAFDALVAPYEQFVNDLKTVKGPSDVLEYHSSLVKLLTDNLATAKKTKDVKALSAGTSPKASQAIQDRLNKAAASNADCKAAGTGFGG